jgi:hypothetical protein
VLKPNLSIWRVLHGYAINAGDHGYHTGHDRAIGTSIQVLEYGSHRAKAHITEKVSLILEEQPLDQR